VGNVVKPNLLASVRAYHEATKHRLQGHAPGPGFLDWDSQPDPFRRYAGAPLVPLPLVAGSGRCSHAELFAVSPLAPEPLGYESMSLFLELSLGLSTWKQAGPDRWALRNNPSSGNLHPTEGYLILWRSFDDADLPPGLYHYAPHEHALERRALLPPAVAQGLAAMSPGSFGALGLSSIIWREEWKYGSRAYRYCQLDVGHAFAAACFAGRVLGWRLRLDAGPDDASTARCLGLDRNGDFATAEREHIDLVAVIGDRDAAPLGPAGWRAIAAGLEQWSGMANRLSAERVAWPEIAALVPAVIKPQLRQVPPSVVAPPIVTTPPGTSIEAVRLIRGRRSAQRMDPQGTLPYAAFTRVLVHTLARLGAAPFDGLGYAPGIDFLIFAHAVEGLASGLYFFDRTATGSDALAGANGGLVSDLGRIDAELPLYALTAGSDVRQVASRLCCHQGIAGRGVFSLAMLANLEGALDAHGPWAYRLLHWEAGMIGQVLYLEAEAVGLRGTGIGCFYDDELSNLLGPCRGSSWETIYAFTIGKAIDDNRLTSAPPYAHLGRERAAKPHG
jgi:SagB-type dehydrogenase family enzyme